MTMTELISAYWPTLLFYSVMAAIIIGVVGFIRGSRESVPLSGIEPSDESFPKFPAQWSSQGGLTSIESCLLDEALALSPNRYPDIPEDLQTLLDAQSKGIQAIIESDVSEKHKIALIIKKKDADKKRAVTRAKNDKHKKI